VWKISEDGGELEGVLELYEHETPVISVAINDANTFVAAGAEDGSLVVWSINCKTRQSSVAFTKLISTAARRYPPSSLPLQRLRFFLRPLTSLRWIPSSNISINSQIGFTADKLVCGTGDGLLVCLDVTGKLFAATKVQPSPDATNSIPFKSNSSVATNAVIGVNCLSIDKRGNVYGGCEDKTIRVWCMEKGYLKELYIQNNVHNGGVTSTSLNKDHTILVSGGDDGTINTWRVELE
jgi:WD40 repeat protein